MPTVTDILHGFARQRGAGPHNPLLLLRTLESRHGSLISQLTINQQLIQTWVRLTGAPFCQHQSLSLASLRRGEPFALVGGGAAARQTLHLLLQDILVAESHTTALLLCPDLPTATIHLNELETLNAESGAMLSHTLVGTHDLPREAPASRVLLATPESLHERLLRFHDRAWSSLWHNLRLLFLIDIDRYTGINIAHLAALLMRSARLVGHPPLLAATLADVRNSESTLLELFGQPWRTIPVDDTPRRPTSLALWNAGDERLADASKLALHYEREGYRVHITCEQVEIPLLMSHIGPELEGISVGPVPQDAQVHLFAGYQESHPLYLQAFAGSFGETPQLVVLLLGSLPVERTLARLNRQDDQQQQQQPPDTPRSSTLFDGPFPAWLPPPTNAYIAAQHLLCAASERPIVADEIAGWQAGDMVARLERRNLLVQLPGEPETWQPLLEAGDPYTDFAMQSASGPVVLLYNERGSLIDTLDPSAFDRWGFQGAALPPGRSGYRVTERNEEQGTLSVRPEREQRRTFPLRRCELTMREERDNRTLQQCPLAWGRVVIDEEVYGYREVKGQGSPVDQGVVPPLTSRWTAPAVWIELPMRMKATGQLVGWSLVMALPLRVLCRHTDLVPAYDPGMGRLYLVDAQPGGNGLAAWCYQHFEELLPLAYDIALDCRNDPLLEPLARTDRDWLLSLLGGTVSLPDERSSGKRAAQVGASFAAPSAPQQASHQQPAPTTAPSQRETTPPPPVDDTEKKTVAPPVPRDEPVEPEPPRKPRKQGRTRSTPPDEEEPPPPPAPPERKRRRQSQQHEHDEDAELPPPPPPPPPPAPPERKRRRQSQQHEHDEDENENEDAPPTPALSSRGDTRSSGKGSRSKRTRTADPPQQQPPPQAPDKSTPSTGTSGAGGSGAAQATGQRNKEPATRRKESSSSSSSRQPPDDEPEPLPPDASAILAKLKSQRKPPPQPDAQGSTRPAQRDAPRFPVEPQFRAGERVVCRLYGQGVVRASRIVDGQEILTIEFPDYGELEINPSVTGVRRVE